MKITDKLFSLPPYISTTWDQVTLLRVSDHQLIVSLKDGSICTIPHLPQETIERIFSHHANALETPTPQFSMVLDTIQTSGQDFLSVLAKLCGSILSPLGKPLAHDPEHANMPELSPELIKKVHSSLNILSKEELFAMEPPVPECLCMYCQIVRILRQEYDKDERTLEEEVVEDHDLAFTEWHVEQVGEKLYKVVHKLNEKEEYRVFLGEPIGCTCGKTNCEHVLAVLRS